MDVAVAVCTYRRPAGLARLLRALAAAAPHAVVVVDNDPDGSAAPVLSAAPLPVIAVHEPRPGIPQARNAALAALPSGCDGVAFLDDDEEPSPGWLDALVTTQAATGAEIVTGPVVPRYGPDVPRWAVRGGFFARRRHPTGTALEFAATNNVLLTRAVLDAGLAFDERLALTGGSDTVLFRRARRAGFRIVWADEAVVYEDVTAERATVRWLCRRAFRLGATLGAMVAEDPTLWEPRWRRGATAVARTLCGLAEVPVRGVLQGRAGVVRGLQSVCRGVGGLAGLAGLRLVEYRRGPDAAGGAR